MGFAAHVFDEFLVSLGQIPPWYFRKGKFSTTSFSIIICWSEFNKSMVRSYNGGVCSCVCERERQRERRQESIRTTVLIFVSLTVCSCLCCVPQSKQSSHFLPFETFWQVFFQASHSPLVLRASSSAWQGSRASVLCVHPCK